MIADTATQLARPCPGFFFRSLTLVTVKTFCESVDYLSGVVVLYLATSYAAADSLQHSATIVTLTAAYDAYSHM